MVYLFEHDLFGKPVSTFPDHALDDIFSNLFRLQAEPFQFSPGKGSLGQDAVVPGNAGMAPDRLLCVSRAFPSRDEIVFAERGRGRAANFDEPAVECRFTCHSRNRVGGRTLARGFNRRRKSGVPQGLCRAPVIPRGEP